MTAGTNAGRLANVQLRHGPSATGPWTVVRQVDYDYYDTAGRPATFTSYSQDGRGGFLVENEVLRVYNGLGQLVTEYQEHFGPVNTALSLKVQYTYSFNEMAGGGSPSGAVSLEVYEGPVEKQ